MDIKINIKNKIAVLAEQARIVCGNSDYTAVFSFDEEWEQYPTKTARFFNGGSYTDIVFTGDRCPIPVMRGVTGVYIGVYSGDMRTSTPTYVSCEKSILCNGGTPKEPTPDVYEQLIELINKNLMSVRAIDTINGDRLRFFVGKQTEYENLTAEEKQNLFAIITDDKTKDEIFTMLATLKQRLDKIEAALKI